MSVTFFTFLAEFLFFRRKSRIRYLAEFTQNCSPKLVPFTIENSKNILHSGNSATSAGWPQKSAFGWPCTCIHAQFETQWGASAVSNERREWEKAPPAEHGRSPEGDEQRKPEGKARPIEAIYGRRANQIQGRPAELNANTPNFRPPDGQRGRNRSELAFCTESRIFSFRKFQVLASQISANITLFCNFDHILLVLRIVLQNSIFCRANSACTANYFKY